MKILSSIWWKNFCSNFPIDENFLIEFSEWKFLVKFADWRTCLAEFVDSRNILAKYVGRRKFVHSLICQFVG